MSSFSIQISSMYIGFSGLLMLTLAALVVKMRIRFKVGIGDDGHEPLLLAIRTHANAVEYVPIALLLLICVENTWQLPWLTHLMGSALILGRVLHAIGLSQQAGESKPRFWGVMLTWIMISVSAIAVIVYGLLGPQ